MIRIGFSKTSDLYVPRTSTSGVGVAAVAEVTIESETRWGRRSAESVQLPEGGERGVHGSQHEERERAHAPTSGTLETN